VRIAGDAAYTTSPGVTLTLAAAGAREIN